MFAILRFPLVREFAIPYVLLRMADGHLYTIRDVARELGLPESTVRYYRDGFSAYLPAVGTGRRRRYPAEAIPLLRLVAEGYSQNRPRVEIEQALSESLGASSVGKHHAAMMPPGFDRRDRDELLATVLDGERERREVMWQMARELVRLGEAIERQHTVLARLAEQASPPSHTLPSASAGEAAGAAGRPAPSSAASLETPSAQHELDQLRQELARERELVERLRRSKLDIERRAAEAEAQLSQGGVAAVRRGLLGRLLAGDDEQRR